MNNNNNNVHLLRRTSSCNSSTAIIPSPYISSTTFILDPSSTTNDIDITSATRRSIGCSPGFFTSRFIRSIINLVSIPTCRWFLPAHLSLTPSHTRRVTGTLFGYRRGHVSFAVQHDTKSEPILVVELAITTAGLVKEMSSGLVRIALECEKQYVRSGRVNNNNNNKLFNEPRWSMYCNGRKCGYALTRACNESDWHVLSTVQTISVGAGVIPVVEDGGKRVKGDEGLGELLYMRARFERVVGSRDSEAFYMMNPDGSTGGPELSIFLLRI